MEVAAPPSEEEEEEDLRKHQVATTTITTTTAVARESAAAGWWQLCWESCYLLLSLCGAGGPGAVSSSKSSWAGEAAVRLTTRWRQR